MDPPFIGMCWWINGLLLPELTVVRGETYYFKVNISWNHRILKDKCQVFVIGKGKQFSHKLWLSISLAGNNIFEVCLKLKAREGEARARADEKGPGSFQPLGVELLTFKVCQFLVLNAKPNFLWPQMEFDHFKSLKLSPGYEKWAHWDPESLRSLPGCSRPSQSY